MLSVFKKNKTTTVTSTIEKINELHNKIEVIDKAIASLTDTTKTCTISYRYSVGHSVSIFYDKGMTKDNEIEKHILSVCLNELYQLRVKCTKEIEHYESSLQVVANKE